jgi:hypothetical protein
MEPVFGRAPLRMVNKKSRYFEQAADHKSSLSWTVVVLPFYGHDGLRAAQGMSCPCRNSQTPKD